MQVRGKEGFRNNPDLPILPESALIFKDIEQGKQNRLPNQVKMIGIVTQRKYASESETLSNPVLFKPTN